MRLWASIRTLIDFFFNRRRVEREMEEEFALHLRARADDLERQGMSRAQAERQARVEFGGIERSREECREALGTRLLGELIGDLRYGLRQLRRSPGFTAVAVITLALGIGASTAVFSVVNVLLLRPFPYEHPSRLVSATEFYPKFNHSMVLTPEYAVWKQQSATFERLSAYSITVGVNMTGGGTAKRVQAGHVTPGFFSMLGVNPILGRSFANGEDHDHVAMLSYGLWSGYFASDSKIIGKAVTINGAPYSVIGVMPSRFLDPTAPHTDIWLPDAVPPAATHPGRFMGSVSVIGRLRPGVSIERARADLEVIARRMDSQYPTPWSLYHRTARVKIVSLRNALTSDARPALLILGGAVAFVLLIACANVANLLLSRAIVRQREIAVRAAVGAARSRLARLLLTESALLALFGGMVGIGLAACGTSALGFLMPATFSGRIPLDQHVLIFTLICSMATGIAFGLAPALRASRLDLIANLKEGSSQLGETRNGSRLRTALMVSQLALSLVLLIGAGLLIRSFAGLLEVNPGFDMHHVLTASVSLPPSLYDPLRQAAFFHQALIRIKSLPGVEIAAAADAPPLMKFQEVGSGLQPEGQPESGAVAGVVSISPDYFGALHIPLLKGRFFSGQDTDSTVHVAIINQALGRALFKNEDPLGRRIRLNEGGPWITVVGEVADIRQRKLDDKAWPELYQTYRQSPAPWMTFVIRASSSPSSLGPEVSKVVEGIDNGQPVFNVKTLDERLSTTLAERRGRMLLLGVFAAMAIAIAMVGLYGVMAYSVKQRTHQIGIRMALGAERRDILKLVLGQGLRLTLFGVAIGITGALAVTRFLSSLLYGVKPTDPLTFIFVSLLLAAVALLAVYIPARRATRVDPVVALRHE